MTASKRSTYSEGLSITGNSTGNPPASLTQEAYSPKNQSTGLSAKCGALGVISEPRAVLPVMPISGVTSRTVGKTRAMYRILCLISRLEAASYLVLLVATAFKYWADFDWGVRIIGPIHGVLYLVFVAAILRQFQQLRWSFKKAVVAMALGSIPLGGFLVERWIRRVDIAPKSTSPIRQ